jgi:hypothetical protein
MSNEEIKSKLTGGCMCGAVRYEFDPSAIVFTTICYCRDCQRQSGSAFTANIAVSASAFQVTKGELKFYERTADNGNKVRKCHFEKPPSRRDHSARHVKDRIRFLLILAELLNRRVRRQNRNIHVAPACLAFHFVHHRERAVFS